MSRPSGGGPNCRMNALIATAPTEVAGHGAVDLSVTRRRLLRQKGRGLHDLSRLAVAALRHAEVSPRHLHGMVPLRIEAFNGRDRAPCNVRHDDTAGANGLTIHMDGASAANRHPTTEFGTRQPEFIPQKPQERHRRVTVEWALLPIHTHIDHDLLPRMCRPGGQPG